MSGVAGDGRTILYTYKHTYTSHTAVPFMWGSLRLAPMNLKLQVYLHRLYVKLFLFLKHKLSTIIYSNILKDIQVQTIIATKLEGRIEWRQGV